MTERPLGDDATSTRISVAVVEDGGCFLVGRRPEGAALAGFAEFPGGKVEPGEQPAEAAVRECLEETGLAVEVTGVYPTRDHQYEHDRLRLHFVACRLRQPAGVPRAPFRWVPRHALPRLRFPVANDELLALLQAGQRPAPLVAGANPTGR